MWVHCTFSQIAFPTHPLQPILLRSLNSTPETLLTPLGSSLTTQLDAEDRLRHSPESPPPRDSPAMTPLTFHKKVSKVPSFLAVQIFSKLMLILAVVNVPVLSEHKTSMEAISCKADMRVTMAWWSWAEKSLSCFKQRTWSLQNRGNAIHSGTPGWWYVFTLSEFLFGL